MRCEQLTGMCLSGMRLRAAERQASDANAAKQRGLYADLLADGTLSLPSDISGDEAAAAVMKAQEVGAAAFLLHDPDALAAFADPSPEAVALAETVFGSWTDAEGGLPCQGFLGGMLTPIAIPLSLVSRGGLCGTPDSHGHCVVSRRAPRLLLGAADWASACAPPRTTAPVPIGSCVPCLGAAPGGPFGAGPCDAFKASPAHTRCDPPSRQRTLA